MLISRTVTSTKPPVTARRSWMEPARLRRKRKSANRNRTLLLRKTLASSIQRRSTLVRTAEMTAMIVAVKIFAATAAVIAVEDALAGAADAGAVDARRGAAAANFLPQKKQRRQGTSRRPNPAAATAPPAHQGPSFNR